MKYFKILFFLLFINCTRLLAQNTDLQLAQQFSANGEEPNSQGMDGSRLSDGIGGSSVEICVELEEGRRELDEGSFPSDPVAVSIEGGGRCNLVVWRCWDRVREGEVDASDDSVLVVG